ncbi:chemotaxis protein [Galenea microaerophila]
MSSFLKGVDQRTSLAGMNRMELLLFRIHGPQLFGINVFKVREVIQTPHISPVPKADDRILGVADIRSQTMPMIDLAKALDMPPIPKDKWEESLTIVTEFNRTIQGFLVESVDRIVHMKWEDIMPPPETFHNVNYLTGVTRINDEIVEIVDVEKVLAEIAGIDNEIQPEFLEKVKSKTEGLDMMAVIADDSSVARNQLKGILEKLGITVKMAANGREAWEMLRKMADEYDKGYAAKPSERILMVISDIEMPEMDGYTLTTNIRKDPRLADLYVLLSSSLSGGFNETLTAKVGANKFISKWQPDMLAQIVVDRIDEIQKIRKEREMEEAQMAAE